MFYFMSIKTGRKYMPKTDYLRNCPHCKKSLHMNKYQDLYVNKMSLNCLDVNICLRMEYCQDCKDLFIRSDY